MTKRAVPITTVGAVRSLVRTRRCRQQAADGQEDRTAVLPRRRVKGAEAGHGHGRGRCRDGSQVRQNRHMTGEEVGLWIQGASVVVALGASVLALALGVTDRRAAQRNAEDDRRAARALAEDERRAALRQAHLLVELEALLRLAENQRRGGSSDAEESSRLGSEAATLTGLIGPERLPHLSAQLNPESDAELRDYMQASDTPEWQRRAVEAHLALRRTVEELRSASS